MRLWHILRSRTRSIVRRRRREAELHEELLQHVDREAERLRESGVPGDVAWHQALRRFGGVEQLKERCRDERGAAVIDAIGRDIRQAIRRLVRDWRFTAAAVLILSLGIGANTAVFSLVNATLYRDPAFADPDRLVDIYQLGSNPGSQDGNSYPAYLDMAAATDVFAGTTAISVPLGVTYLDGGALRSAVAEYTTETYLSVLGLQPSLGRWFVTAEAAPGVAVVAVLGHEAWMRKFRADPSVIGRTIRIDGVPVTIVGVGPAGHRGTINIGLVTDFWFPIASMNTFGAPPRALERRPDEAAFFVKARLRDGVTLAHAQAAMQVLGARLASDYPSEDPGKGIAVFASTDVRIHPQMDGLLTVVAFVLLVVVGLVLAIACSNLATLLLVRGTARAKEVSVRLSLGATRAQLVRHLLAESLILALAGCVAGCVLAWWMIRMLGTIDSPVVVDLSLGLRVLVFAVVVSIVTGLTFGLAPALRATRVDLAPTLRGDGTTGPMAHRWLTLRNALVALQVGVSVVLLGATGVFLEMLSTARTVRAGFAVDGVAMLETDLRYGNRSAADMHNVLEGVRIGVAAIPGVQASALIRGRPLQTEGAVVTIEGVTAPSPQVLSGVGAIWVGPGFFDALRIPVLFGRAPDERDRSDTPRVAVISETMARYSFGADNVAGAVGRRFRLEREGGAHDWIEVIGVARDIRTDLVDHRPQVFYRSFAQSNLPPTTLIARTSLDADSLLGAMRRDWHAVEATLPLVSARTMAQYLDESLAAPTAAATLLGALGALGLGLAGIGLYAVLAFAVSRRSREIGIRMALGARSRQVVRSVAGEAALIVGVGTIAGLALTTIAILALRAIVVETPGVSLYRPAADLRILVLIAVFMAIVGLVSAFVPARRAARMDPLIALRRD